tara:strand:+ start:245 stop:481 length:237 start_codon:yes stop_codon:yes gene_type:complete
LGKLSKKIISNRGYEVGQINKISPCIGVCSIDPESQLCTGCLRSSDEIAIWSQIDNKKALEIMKEIKNRSLTKFNSNL